MINRIRDEEGDPAIPYDSWKSPLITRDPNSGLFSLYLDKKAYDPKKNFTGSVGDLEVKARLFFNSNMWGLFGNFPSKRSGNDVFNQVNLTDAAYELVPLDMRGIGGEDVKDRDGTEYFRLQQDFDSTATLWSPVDALVFTTSMIPVNAEISGNPIVFTDGKVAPSQGSDNISELVITDLQSGLSGADGYTSSLLTYNPTAEFRMSDFSVQKDYDLRDISVRAQYRNRIDGKLYPVKLANRGTASLKFMFRKKKFM